MGFLEDLTKKASGIVSKGKNFLNDQLSTETTYERDATGNFQMTSTTGNKPKIVNTAKEFFLSGRGYTDAQIAAAKPTKKETVVGVAKAAGEIVQGGLTLTHMLGNKIADTVLPGYDAEASAASRNKINEKVSAKLAPKTAGEAKVMRVTDVLGFVAAPTKVTKLTKVDDLIKASNKTDAFKALKANGFTDDAIRTGNLDTEIANAADEVAVQNVLKDVIPPVKTKVAKTEASIVNEVKKYKSADDFVNEIADRKYITDRTPKERTALDMLVQKELYKNQTPQPVKISSLDFNERQTLKDYKPKPGNKINDPIIVEKGVVKDGHHRVAQAIANGDDTILAFEKIDYDTKRTQLTDIWNQAQKTKSSPIEAVTKKPTKQFDIPKKPTGEVDVDTYVKQQTKLRESARGDKTIRTKTAEFLQNLENKMIDFTSPIQRRVNAAKKSDPLAMSTKDDIANNIDRVFNTPSITNAFIKEKGFAKAVQSIDEADLDAFDQYLTAKHAIDLDAKGIKTGRNVEADSALVAQLGPKFDNAAKEIQKFNEERLEYMVESGLISRELKDSLMEKHPNYVPFQRVFSEDELASRTEFSSSGVASLSKQSVVNKIVGSEREIESPLESLLELTEKAVRQGEKNKAALTLTSYADLPNNPFGLRKISKTTDAAPDKDTISVLRNGKKEIWEVDADVAKAAKALDVERMNILGKILAAPLRLARLGITGVNVPFVAANVVRDQMGAFIMSDKGLRSSIANPRIWLAGLGEAIGHGKLYDEMLSEGALMTSFDVVRDSVKPTLKGIMADKSRLSKAKYIAKNPSQWFRAVENAIGRSEEVTRMQQYLGNKQAALAEGATEAQARVIAARAARENSTNFARRGEWGTVMNNTILYLNAGIQGSRLLVRNLKNKPVKTSAKIATTLMLPAATITYWNLSDPKRKEAYEDIRDYEKKNNFIIVPPDPVKDEDGRWNVIKIPLPPGVGQFTNFVRRPIEESQGLDEVQFAEAASNLLRTVSPTDLSNPMSSLTPQILKPSAQAYSNKNYFTGYPIVPKSMQDLPPEQQVKDTTSGTATDIANALGVSPIKTEQFINDTLGGIGPQILNAADRITGQEVVGGRSIPEGVLRRFTSAAGNKLEAEQLDEIYSLRTEARGETNEIKKTAEATLAELRTMPKDQANAELKRIFDENRPLYDAINKARKQEDRGLSKVEAALEDLPVKDGTRAAYIYTQFKEIEESSPEDAQAYIVELRKKKVISDEVWKQLKELRKEE